MPRRSGQNMNSPLRQWTQRPQVTAEAGSTVTRSPTATPSTPGPTSATVPANSWPMITGG